MATYMFAEYATNLRLNKNKTIWHKAELREWLGGNPKSVYEYVKDMRDNRIIHVMYKTEFIKNIAFVFDYKTGKNIGVEFTRSVRPKGSPKLSVNERHEEEIVELLEVIRTFERNGLRLCFLTYEQESEGDYGDKILD